MPLNASSEWISRIQGYKPEISRKLYIGTSDYSQYVVKWPRIKTDWIRMSPNNITIDLANEGKTFNFLRSGLLGFTYDCEIKISQRVSVSSVEEEITTYKGNINRIKYSNGACKVSIVDKWNILTNRIIGTEDSPQNYTNSNYLPSDLAWYFCTSHSGLSSIGSDANPDIDYNSFLDWAAIMSGDNIVMQAYLKGEKSVDGLRRIGRLTNTAIYVSPDNRLTFKRFSLVDTNITQFDNSKIKGTSIDIAEDSLINKFYQKAAYSVASDYHTITVFDIDSDSVNSYGLHEEINGDDIVWFVNTNSALDSAQRQIRQFSSPEDDLKLDTTLYALPSLIGETIVVQDDLLDVNLGYRVIGTDIDYDKGTIKVSGNRRLFFDGFQLDVSTLDGADVLS